jgi:hypothetical protein
MATPKSKGALARTLVRLPVVVHIIAVRPWKKSCGVVPHSMMSGAITPCSLLKETQILQRLDDAGIVEVHLVAVLVHQDDVVLRRQPLEQPVGEAGARDLHAVLGDVAGGILDRQLLAELDLLLPGRGRHLGVEPGGGEGLLVPVEHRGRALERHAPELPATLPFSRKAG